MSVSLEGVLFCFFAKWIEDGGSREHKVSTPDPGVTSKHVFDSLMWAG